MVLLSLLLGACRQPAGAIIDSDQFEELVQASLPISSYLDGQRDFLAPGEILTREEILDLIGSPEGTLQPQDDQIWWLYRSPGGREIRIVFRHLLLRTCATEQPEQSGQCRNIEESRRWVMWTVSDPEIGP